MMLVKRERPKIVTHYLSTLLLFPYLCRPFTNTGGGASVAKIENQHVLPCAFKKSENLNYYETYISTP